jgi:hypothetical protein
VNPTPTIEGPMSVTVACAWCRRDGGARGPDDSRAIVGLCERHIAGFFERVESLLTSCAELAKSRRRGQQPEPVSPAPGPEPTVAELLRGHGGLTLCDACIAAELDWPAERVSSEAARLPVSDFLRDHWRCARCGARGLVTRLRTRRSRMLEQKAA